MAPLCMLRKARILSGLRAEKLISASELSLTEITSKRREHAAKTPCAPVHSLFLLFFFSSSNRTRLKLMVFIFILLTATQGLFELN